MSTTPARTAKLKKGFAVAQASILMLGLLFMSVPTPTHATDIGESGTGWTYGLDHQHHALTIVKDIEGGDAQPEDFSVTVTKHFFLTPWLTSDDEFTFNEEGEIHITPQILFLYSVVENDPGPDYTASYSNCENIHNDTCTITNTFNESSEPATCTFVSDETTMVGDAPSVLTFVHAAWTHALDASGAKWIWNGPFATPSDSIDEIVTFTKQFNVVGTPTTVMLNMAADNSYTVTVNGNAPTCDGSGLNNFNPDTGTYGASGGPDNCDITSLVNTGVNTLVFTVNNKSGYGTVPTENPGGLIYSVVIDGASCAAVPPPPPVPGTLVIYKSVVGAPEGVGPEDFQISVMTTGEGAGNVANSPHAGSGSGVSYQLAPGNYTVSEPANPNYTTTYSETCSDGTVEVAANQELGCTVTNTYHPTTVDVIATKIVCDNEADLPNLAGSSHVTDATTATTFLANHPSCHLASGWQFEWGNQDATYPGGSFVGPAGAGYTTSAATDGNGTVTMTIPVTGVSSIHLREVLTSGFIPFSDNNENTVSAELACSNDGLNYDNWDFINGPETGSTYYCVAYNAPKKTDVTLCKYDEQEHALSGWNLTLTGEHIEDISVPTNTSSGINSVASLFTGTSYLAKVAGTWTNQGGANPVDAEYSTTDSWATHMDGYTGYGAGILETEINQTDGSWGPYNSGHQYAQSFMGTNVPGNFRIFDGDTGTHVQNEGWFGDNNGSLAVGLYKGYAGVTGEDGCVTFTNVPYGTYTVGETPKDGWANTSGLNEVTVGDESNHFNVVNHLKMCTIVSDTVTLEDGSPATDITALAHEAWTAVITGATWIWGENHALTDSSETDSSETFTRTFTLTELPLTDGQLAIAADNGYTVKLNGVTIGSDLSEQNYNLAGQDVVTVPLANLVVGVNTLEITVDNHAQEGGTWASNPAGLLYKLTLTGADCEGVEPPPTVGDMCANIEGTQTEIPANYYQSGNDCIKQSHGQPQTESGSNGGGGSGEVQGESTVAPEVLGESCGLYMDKYLRLGHNDNDSDQTKKLQTFLNKWVNANLPVTGFFGKLTENQVKAFQSKYSDDVLKPWGIGAPTGLVYLSTLRKINLLECPELTLDLPPLVAWSQNPSAH